MTRGRPAVWSSVFGAPFVAVGVYVCWFQSQYPLVADQPTAPPVAGVPLVLFGLFVVGLGVYVQLVAVPGRPTMRENERVVDERDPAQRGALLKAVSSVPFLTGGLYLLYFTTHPLVYPTVVLAVGLYCFSTGVHEYWRNTLTSYVLTNRRLLEEYRFVSLSRNEVPLDKVRAVRERRSFVDTLFGLGNVYVRAGATGDLSVTVESVYDSTEFADEIRREMDRDRADEATGRAGSETRTDDIVPDEDGSVGRPVESGASDVAAARSGRESLSDGGTPGSVPAAEERS